MATETATKAASIPLAERMRPRGLDEFAGQEHLVGPGRLIRRAIEADTLGSMILWGPPGRGKTALAHIIAHTTRRAFVSFSAVLQGVKEVRQLVEEAKRRQREEECGTILFVDEIHRFNKAQQDAFLPHVESGTIILIGATTQNPSFEINSALLSRCRVYTLNALDDAHVAVIVERALSDAERGLGDLNVELAAEALEVLVNYANGDARAALNALELAAHGVAEKGGRREVTRETMREAIASRAVQFDNQGEEFYNLISALHKSLRGSDPQAGLYWLARMLEGGAPPLYIARRLVRFASEDIGLADPQALAQANAAKDAVHFLGLPEGDTALAQAVIYLATAPKSNRVYRALKAATHDVAETRNEPVPPHLRNAPTKLMREQGYGKGYQYDHDAPDAFSGQDFLPEALAGAAYYEPGPYGFEKDIKRRLDYWERLRRQRREEGKNT